MRWTKKMGDVIVERELADSQYMGWENEHLEENRVSDIMNFL
jgi:hypothetical protein